jgi:hypothetical protein
VVPLCAISNREEVDRSNEYTLELGVFPHITHHLENSLRLILGGKGIISYQNSLPGSCTYVETLPCPTDHTAVGLGWSLANRCPSMYQEMSHDMLESNQLSLERCRHVIITGYTSIQIKKFCTMYYNMSASKAALELAPRKL